MRLTLAIAVSSLALGGLSVEVHAAAGVKMLTDIPPQGLDSALATLANERDFQIVYLSDSVDALQTKGATGELTSSEALTKLLSGTGLDYRYLDDKTVTVYPHHTSAVPASALSPNASAINVSATETSEDPGSVWQRFRLAQAGGVSATTADSEPTTDREGNSEVIVTAQKRSERLQDVPISISVLNGADLDKSTADGVLDALRGVPGVAPSLNVFGGSSNVSIRGVSAAGPLYFGSSPVAYYVDSVPFGLVKSAISPDSSAYDLERVEVLRGPQGTLYGASAQAGVIRILTTDPVMNQFDVKVRSSGSYTEYGGGNYRADTAVNIPLIDDKLAARAVVGYENDSGWIDRPDQKNANDDSLLNLRLKLRAQPTEELSLGASVWTSRSNYGALPYSPNDRNIDFLNDEPVHTDFDAYGVKIGYQFPTFQLTSATSYLDYKNQFEWETAAPPNDALLDTINGSHVFTQDLYLASTAKGPWQWTAGATYRDGKDRLYQALPVYSYVEDEYDISKSYAVFGELTRQLTDHLDLTGGLRYFHDEVTDGEYVSGAPPAPIISNTSTFHKVSPRGVLSWHVTDDQTVYASYSEGFRSGGNQDPATLHIAPFPAFKPDNLKNYELGTKGNLWQGRVTFDASVYYMDWQNVQQLLTVPIPSLPGINSAEIINGVSASGIGVDFATTVQITDNFAVSANVSWNNLTQDDPVVAFPTGAPQGVVVFGKGDRLNLSPEDTAGGTADYRVPLGTSGYKAKFSASISYVSSQFYRRLVATGVDTTPGENITIGRVAASLDSPDHWTATLFVDNVNNEQNAVFQHWTDVPQRNLYVRPRTVGLQFDYRLK
jgi:iron complex outermembrane recepter protein